MDTFTNIMTSFYTLTALIVVIILLLAIYTTTRKG